jgi:hypothetical protein
VSWLHRVLCILEQGVSLHGMQQQQHVCTLQDEKRVRVARSLPDAHAARCWLFTDTGDRPLLWLELCICLLKALQRLLEAQGQGCEGALPLQGQAPVVAGAMHLPVEGAAEAVGGARTRV